MTNSNRQEPSEIRPDSGIQNAFSPAAYKAGRPAALHIDDSVKSLVGRIISEGGIVPVLAVVFSDSRCREALFHLGIDPDQLLRDMHGLLGATGGPRSDSDNGGNAAGREFL